MLLLGGIVSFALCSAISMVMDVMLPPLIAQEVAVQAPWAAPKITRWVFQRVPEAYVDNDWAEAVDGGLVPASTGVFNGGAVEFQGVSVPDPEASCIMSSTALTDCFDVPRPGYQDHGGIDYGTTPNQPVVTPMAGTVTYAGWSEVGYGNLVVIESNGVQIYMAHHNEILVAVGDVVTVGQVVALSGSTGNSTGAHIHFEVRVCDPETGTCSAVDPNSFILPGQTGACDWYFGQQISVQYVSGFQYSCGVDGLEVHAP